MALLSTFTFTNNARRGDLAIAPLNGGWQNIVSTINALAGDDTVSATGAPDLTDVATFGGTVAFPYSAGIANGGSGAIDMGAGRDLLTSSVGAGARSIGILNGQVGSLVKTNAAIRLGTGDDEMLGSNASQIGVNSFGIYNTGTIDCGTGNDVVTGIKASVAASGAAIFNQGSMLGGTGNDEFDAFQGGWAGTGTVDGGTGDDVVWGFGSGTFNGGAGLKDELILPAGTYAVKYNAVPTATTANFYLTKDGGVTQMNVLGFEAIASINPLAGIHPTAVDGLRPSAFTIDANGDFTSVTFVGANSAL